MLMMMMNVKKDEY